MAELQSQLNQLRSQTGASTRRITAPQAGLYSAVVDGYETVLTPQALETLTPSQFSELEPDTSVSSTVGKLILGDTWYYAAVMDQEEAQLLQESGSLQLRFAKGIGQDLDVSLTRVSEPEDGQVVAVFRGNTYLSELTLLRRQSAEVIHETESGIRVPIEAVRLVEETVTGEDGTETTVSRTGVYCIVGLEARFKPVDVVYQNEEFALVRSSLEGADGMTTAQEEIRLREGDEVIVTARDLYDGKIIGDL